MRISDQEANRLSILKAIRRSEPVARTDLVRLTGLAGGTITEVTAELVRRMIITEEKQPAAGRGRPRIALRLNPDAGCFVGGLLFENGLMRIDFANLRGDTLFHISTGLGRSTSIEDFADQIASLLNDAISASPFRKAEIHSIGIGLPATIDSRTGTLHWQPPFPPSPVPFAGMLEERLGAPVLIDNIANVMARAEHWFGKDDQLDDFSLITLGLGLGLGRYVDGRPWNSSRGVNAEFGHMKVALARGRQCFCGATDCLASYAAISGIVAAMRGLRGLAPPSFEQSFEDFHGFADEARAGQADACETFELAGTLLGMAVANHINVRDPARIIILATDAVLMEMISPPFHAAVEQNVLPALRQRTRIDMRLAEGDHYAQGAAALVLERLYRLPAVHGWQTA